MDTVKMSNDLKSKMNRSLTSISTEISPHLLFFRPARSHKNRADHQYHNIFTVRLLLSVIFVAVIISCMDKPKS